MPLLESHSAWTAVAYLSIAASSVYYTWVWRRPQHFKALVHPKDPSEVRFCSDVHAADATAQFL